MYPKLKRYSALFFYTFALLPALLIVLIFGTRLFYKCWNSYLALAIFLSAIVLAWLLSLRVQKLEKPISFTLLVFFISLIVGSIYLGSFNCARCITPSATMSHLLSVLGERNFSQMGLSYKSLCEEPILLKMKSAIKPAMLENSRRCYGPVLDYILPEKSVDNLFVCNANSESYAVEVYLHDREEYACVDNKTKIRFSEKSIGEATSCGN